MEVSAGNGILWGTWGAGTEQIRGHGDVEAGFNRTLLKALLNVYQKVTVINSGFLSMC